MIKYAGLQFLPVGHLRVSHSCIAPCCTNSGFFAPGLQSRCQDRLNDRGAHAFATVYQQVGIECVQRVQRVQPDSNWFLFCHTLEGTNNRVSKQPKKMHLRGKKKANVKCTVSTVARREHYMRMAGEARRGVAPLSNMRWNMNVCARMQRRGHAYVDENMLSPKLGLRRFQCAITKHLRSMLFARRAEAGVRSGEAMCLTEAWALALLAHATSGKSDQRLPTCRFDKSIECCPLLAPLSYKIYK